MIEHVCVTQTDISATRITNPHRNTQGYLKPNNPFIGHREKLVSNSCSNIVNHTVRVNHIHGLGFLQALASLVGETFTSYLEEDVGLEKRC